MITHHPPGLRNRMHSLLSIDTPGTPLVVCPEWPLPPGGGCGAGRACRTPAPLLVVRGRAVPPRRRDLTVTPLAHLGPRELCEQLLIVRQTRARHGTLRTRRVAVRVTHWRRGSAVALLGGLLVFVALAVFAVGLVAFVRGRLGWARIRSRTSAARAIVVACALFVAGGLFLPSTPTQNTASTLNPSATITAPTTAATTTTTTAPTTTTTAPTTVTPAAPGLAFTPLGVAVPVRDAGGNSATVTLNGVRFAPIPSYGADAQLVVLDLTFVGTGGAFKYSQNDIHAAYLNSVNETDPAYAHQIDKLAMGSRPMEDYRPFLPPDPLRIGTVTAGQVKNGLVIIRAGSRGPYIVFLGSLVPAEHQAQWVAG